MKTELSYESLLNLFREAESTCPKYPDSCSKLQKREVKKWKFQEFKIPWILEFHSKHL